MHNSARTAKQLTDADIAQNKENMEKLNLSLWY